MTIPLTTGPTTHNNRASYIMISHKFALHETALPQQVLLAVAPSDTEALARCMRQPGVVAENDTRL